MKMLMSLLLGSLLISSASFAQERGRDRDPVRGELDRGGRGERPPGRPDRGGDRDRDRDRGPDREPDRGPGRPSPQPGRGNPSAFQDYSGAIEQGNFCTTCAFENRADVPRSTSRKGNERYLVNADQDSVDARCQELGWDYGQALQWYTYQEWCKYDNARTRTWDNRRGDWTFGSCRDGNVKVARCFRR